MSVYDLISRNTNSSVWENPENPNDLLRVIRTIAPKKSGTGLIDNVKTDVGITRRKDPRGEDCTDCSVVLENLSVRMSLSGSTANSAELAKMFDTLIVFVKENRNKLLAGQTLPVSTSVTVNPTYTLTVS